MPYFRSFHDSENLRERIKGHFAVPQSHERKKSPGIGISNFRRIRMRELNSPNFKFHSPTEDGNEPKFGSLPYF